MKLKKKSGLMGAVIALSAASLVSVGFASWVISQGDTKTVDGTVFVDTVDTRNRTIIDYIIDPDHTVVSFAAPATANSGWLTASQPYTAEQLDVIVTFKVENVTAAYAGAKVSIAPLANATNFNTAVSEGYIAEPTNKTNATPDKVASGFVANGKKDADNNDLGTQSYTITFSYAWGATKFNSQNPYVYYNALSASADSGIAVPDADPARNYTNAELAAVELGRLNTLLTGVTYQVTIVAE